MLGTSQPSKNVWVLLYDSFYELVSAAGICHTYILQIVSILNYLFDIFNDTILSFYSMATPPLLYHVQIKQLQTQVNSFWMQFIIKSF